VGYYHYWGGWGRLCVDSVAYADAYVGDAIVLICYISFGLAFAHGLERSQLEGVQ